MRKKTKRKEPITEATGNVVVKIYPHRREIPGYKRPWVTWQVADFTTGERRMRAFTTLEKARKEAKKLADQIASGETVAAQMRNTEAASYGRAVELIRPTGQSLEIAAATFTKIWELVGDRGVEAAAFFKRHGADQIQTRLVPKVVEELTKLKEARGKSDRYVGDLKARLTRFADDFNVNIDSITTGDISGWIDKLKGSPQTAKNFRTVIGTLFNYAEARGYIMKGGNPVDGVEHIEANGGAIQIYTPDEITALLKAAPQDFLPVIALGAFSGLRSAEIDRLEWSAIDLPAKLIHVAAEKAKTRARRLVPILDNLGEWLAPYSAKEGLIFKGTGTEYVNAKATTVTKAKIPWKPNALRHSFISYRLADIQDVAQVALEAGNSPETIFAHYRELVKPEAAKTWFTIGPETPANVVTLKAAVAAKP